MNPHPPTQPFLKGVDIRRYRKKHEYLKGSAGLAEITRKGEGAIEWKYLMLFYLKSHNLCMFFGNPLGKTSCYWILVLYLPKFILLMTEDWEPKAWSHASVNQLVNHVYLSWRYFVPVCMNLTSPQLFQVNLNNQVQCTEWLAVFDSVRVMPFYTFVTTLKN